jgi:hypothetical protein
VALQADSTQLQARPRCISRLVWESADRKRRRPLFSSRARRKNYAFQTAFFRPFSFDGAQITHRYKLNNAFTSKQRSTQ